MNILVLLLILKLFMRVLVIRNILYAKIKVKVLFMLFNVTQIKIHPKDNFVIVLQKLS